MDPPPSLKLQIYSAIITMKQKLWKRLTYVLLEAVLERRAYWEGKDDGMLLKKLIQQVMREKIQGKSEKHQKQKRQNCSGEMKEQVKYLKQKCADYRNKYEKLKKSAQTFKSSAPPPDLVPTLLLLTQQFNQQKSNLKSQLSSEIHKKQQQIRELHERCLRYQIELEWHLRSNYSNHKAEKMQAKQLETKYSQTPEEEIVGSRYLNQNSKNHEKFSIISPFTLSIDNYNIDQNKLGIFSIYNESYQSPKNQKCRTESSVNTEDQAYTTCSTETITQKIQMTDVFTHFHPDTQDRAIDAKVVMLDQQINTQEEIQCRSDQCKGNQANLIQKINLMQENVSELQEQIKILKSLNKNHCKLNETLKMDAMKSKQSNLNLMRQYNTLFDKCNLQKAEFEKKIEELQQVNSILLEENHRLGQVIKELELNVLEFKTSAHTITIQDQQILSSSHHSMNTEDQVIQIGEKVECIDKSTIKKGTILKYFLEFIDLDSKYQRRLILLDTIVESLSISEADRQKITQYKTKLQTKYSIQKQRSKKQEQHQQNSLSNRFLRFLTTD